jgi:deoxyribose-phosphate aldolase
MEGTINQYLEHTYLKPDTTIADVRTACEAALEHQLGGVCIPPLYIREARRVLGDASKTRLVTVVGYPMGYSAIAAKSEEIKRAVDEGADDIDAVINISAVKSGLWNHVENDIEAIGLATNMRGRTMKLILEMGFLTEAEIERICGYALQSKAKFLKTGTGMFGNNATVDQVKMLKKYADASLKIKASGGIRTLAEAKALVEAGADRIGTSSALQIISKK